MTDEELVIETLKKYPNGIALDALNKATGLNDRSIRTVLHRMERNFTLGAYMRNGVLYYSYHDWNATGENDGKDEKHVRP